MDYSMRGWAKLYERRSKTQIAQAKDLFDSALHIDPDNVDAMIGKAWCFALMCSSDVSAKPMPFRPCSSKA